MIMTTMMIENQGDQDLRDQKRKGSIDQGQNTRAAVAARVRREAGQYDSPSSSELQLQRDRPAWCLQSMVPSHLCLVDGSLLINVKLVINLVSLDSEIAMSFGMATRKIFCNISVLLH